MLEKESWKGDFCFYKYIFFKSKGWFEIVNECSSKMNICSSAVSPLNGLLTLISLHFVKH